MTGLPLERYLLFETSDLDEACERVGRVFCRHRLDYAGRGRHLSARQHVLKLGHLALSYVAYGEEVAIDAGEPGSCFLVHRTQNGRSEIRVGDSRLVGSRSMGSVISATLALRMRWSANCAHLVLRVDRPALERHLSDLIGEAAVRPIEFAPEMPWETGHGASFGRLIDFVSAEVEREDTLLASPLAIANLEQMVMTALLTAQPSNYSVALSAQGNPAAPRHVVRAEEYIRTHADQVITVSDLARAGGVTARTLFEGFRRFRGTTPFSMLKTVRLERVHAELQAAGPSGRVSEIALKWGFVHLGRFAELYRRRFGERPSDTLRR
jgi:AraC-like DNA-binding protein